MGAIKRLYTYVTNQGAEYGYALKREIAVQVNDADPAVSLVGAVPVPGTANLASLPNGMRPRGVMVHDPATGRKRFVPCMTAAAPLFAGTSTQITLRDALGVNAAYTVHATVGERGERVGTTSSNA